MTYISIELICFDFDFGSNVMSGWSFDDAMSFERHRWKLSWSFLLSASNPKSTYSWAHIFLFSLSETDMSMGMSDDTKISFGLDNIKLVLLDKLSSTVAIDPCTVAADVLA